MKKKLSLLVACGMTVVFATAQNVGIGNTNPEYKLDLSGRLRIRGGIDNNYTAGIWFSGVGPDSLNLKTFFGHKSDTSLGVYSPLNNWKFNIDPRNGHLGLGGIEPLSDADLAFTNTAGNKISLYRDGNNLSYGFGIGSSMLQVITPDNTNDVVFGTGSSNSFTENMRVGGNGNVSIGNAPISFAGLTVDKKEGATHALFGSNTTGVAIESSFPGIGFNSYYNGSRKNIANGYSGHIGVNPIAGGMQFMVSTQSNNAGVTGTYKSAIEIRPDGKVGIGVTDPAYGLDIAERMRIRAKPGFTAGLWLNNEANTAIPAFIGMQADNQVGFFGLNGTGWSFLMNTLTGAISFGGNAGQPGQVLTSSGTGGAPVWQGGLGGGKPFVIRPSANSPDLFANAPRVDVPGMVANFTLSVPSQVVFNYKLSIANRSCVACGDRRTFIILVQNIIGGTNDIATTYVYTPNGEIADGVSGPIVVDLPAGTYSYKLVIAPSIYGAATVYARQQEGIMTWQIYPN